MISRTFVLGALLTAVVWSPGSSIVAQAPTDRRALRDLRDSLALSQDESSLRTLERQAFDDARSRRDDPYAKMRLGFIDLRLAAVTSDAGKYNDAASEFEWASQLKPDWPMAWLGRGFAELGSIELGSAIARVGQVVLGIDPVTRPATFIARSAEVDSSYLDGLVELASLALRQRSETQVGVALNAFRRLGGRPAAHNATYLVARGRLEREVGDLDSGYVALRELLDREPDNPAALLEFARTRYAAGALDGEEAWYRGLAGADARTIAEYRADLDVLMPDSALRAFDAASGAARVEVARRFWESRAGAELHASNERLREHYVRLNYVWHNLIVRPEASYDATPHDAIEPAWFDDRGRIYLKHGKPDETTYVKFTGAYDNESWRYRQEDGSDLLFHFLKPPGAPGYHSVESLFDIIATTTAARMKGVINPSLELAAGNAIETYGAGWLASTAQEILTSREYLSPIYARILAAGKHGAAELQAEERASGRASLEAPDTWHLSYELALNARIDALAVGADSAGPAVQIAFALPGTSLFPKRTAFGYMYQVRVRAVLLGLDGEPVASVDNTRGYLSRSEIGATQFLLGRLPLQAPPGTYRMRIAMESAGRGTITAWDTVRIAAPAGPSLGLSDLALGSRKVQLSLRPAAGDTAWVNPVHDFARRDPMELYFEVNGLSRGTPYRVELAVAEVHGSALGKLVNGTGDALRIAFDGSHSGGVDRVHRELDLHRLGPGDYVLRVVITTRSGEKVTRQRTFTVTR